MKLKTMKISILLFFFLLVILCAFNNGIAMIKLAGEMEKCREEQIEMSLNNHSALSAPTEEELNNHSALSAPTEEELNNHLTLSAEELFNGVTLNDFSYESILRRYPKVDINTCLEYSNDNTGRLIDSEPWFEIDRSVNNIQKNKKIMSFSLFRRKVDYPFGPYPDEMVAQWEDRYVTPFVTVFDENNPDHTAQRYKGFDFHLYLANDLAYLVDEDKIPKHENLTIHIMKSSSIGASPGSLWRHLSLSNQNYDFAVVSDTDHNEFITSFIDAAIGSLESNDFSLVTVRPGDVFVDGRTDPDAPKQGDCMNTAIIMAGIIAAKPSAFNFEMKRVVAGFMKLVDERLKHRKPLTFTDDEPITFWNSNCVGSTTHKNGWGSDIFGYGFDERFLKHVVYYAAGEGRVKFQ